MIGDVRHAGKRRCCRPQGAAVTGIAAYLVEQSGAVRGRSRERSWGGRRQQTSKSGEEYSIATLCNGILRVGVVFGRAVEDAARDRVSFVGEGFVGDALFDVISLADEDHQRLVLRLPPEAGDGAIV